MVPRVGQKIGPYEILGRLGSGGMGLVFSAWDVRLQRDVALKLLRDEFVTPGARSRFLQEARAASRLNHPNICTVFDIGEQQGDPYLVMELLKGETVRTRVARGPMSREDIITVATEVASALVVAHGQGVVHRDIKPANIILVEKSGGGFQSKVLDFGLAKMDTPTGHDVHSDLTSAGTTVGTVSYMSPEQARGEVLDARSDLFSLGVVLYEMATGQLPFQGATSALIFVQLLSHRPEPIREFNSEIPRDLERVISKLLEKGRGDRFQSARELVEALHRVDLRRTNPARSLWNRGRNPVPRPAAQQPTSSQPPEATPSPSNQKSSGGESVLRPVKRIVASDGYRTSSRPDSSHPSPFPTPPSASSSGPASGFAPGFAAPPISSSGSGSAPPSAPGSGSGAERGTTPPPTPPPGFGPLGRSPISNRPRRTLERIPVIEEEDAPDFTSSGSKLRNRISAVAILLVLLAGVVAWRIMSHRTAPPLRPPTALLVGPLTNRTGDSTLGGTLAAALSFDLQQSPAFSVRDSSGFAAGLKLIGAPDGVVPSMTDALHAARTVGAADLVLGEIVNDNSGYSLSLRAFDTTTGKRLLQVSESTSSREQIPDAIDRLAADLRSGLGESGDSIGRTSIPLGREASSNLDALAAYVNGDSLAGQGRLADAMLAFQHAVELDPHFSQAHLRLAAIYRRQNAEVAAAQSATRAVDAAGTAGTRSRLLAEAAYAMDAEGDLPHALRLLAQVDRSHPGDIEAGRLTALIDRLEGKYTDSLAAAQAVLEHSPYDPEATDEAELAMLALDRVDAAAALEQQSVRAGNPHPEIDVLAAYLGSSPGSSPDPSAASPDGASADSSQDSAPAHIAAPDPSFIPDDFAPAEMTASLLDAQGNLASGLIVWNSVAERAQALPGLGSSAGYALARAALDSALASDCPAALELLQRAAPLPAGRRATYAEGLTAALCGNLDSARARLASLTAASAQAFLAQSSYIPALNAAIQWKSGDSASALATLESSRQFDLISLAPYLRALIHLSASTATSADPANKQASGKPASESSSQTSSSQAALAIVDFQSVLLHRGSTALLHAEIYPLAQLGLARAFAATGDTTNSSAAYARFLRQWSDADPATPLATEAIAHSH